MVETTRPDGPVVATTVPQGYGPVDLQTAYSLTALSANKGVGRTVAIVDSFDDPNAESDLGIYRSTYGLSPCTTANGCFKKINQTGGTTYPSPDAGWAFEISMDLDMVSAIAPNAHILLVEANDDSPDSLGAAVNEAVAQGANIVSNSYGTDGDSGMSGFDHYYNHPGVAILASSGDGGWSNSDVEPADGANFPASSPSVTAVGGTSLTAISPRTETVWGDWEVLGGGGTGSGCSTFEPAPSWQSFFTSCGGFRSVADISADADPNTGIAYYDSYGVTPGFHIGGGTSVAAPIWAGIDALLASSAWANGFSYSHTSDYFDITQGSNGVLGACNTNPATEPQCNAGTGYDGPTGNGTPNGALLPAQCTAPTVTGNPSSTTVTTPEQAQFTASATNSSGCSTFTVQWQVSTDQGATWTNDTGDTGGTTNTLTIGTTTTSMSGDQYRAVFTNEYSSVATTAATLTVNPPPADLSIIDLGSPNPVVSGQPLTYTITVSNTGGQTAGNVAVNDALPASGVFKSMSSTQGTCTHAVSSASKNKGGTVNCSVGSLSAGGSATITIVIVPTKAGALSDTATVTADGISSDTDDSYTTTTTVVGV